MIVIVGSRHDAEARNLVQAWSRNNAALLSAEDMISPGWIIRPGDVASSTAVVAGRRVPVRALRAVLTRRPAVLVEELPDIHAEDRAYVAAEINALLVAWLTVLPCRVLNRPTATSLCGPGWSSLHWQAAAARCGLLRASNDSPPTQTVVVCDEQVHGTRSISLRKKALSLARHAGVQLLELRLSAGRLVHASVCPDLTTPAVRSMVHHALLAGNYT